MRDSGTEHLRWVARAFGDPNYIPLTIRDLESLEAVSTVEKFGTGARLYRAGDPADSCYLIRSGTVQLVGGSGRAAIGLCEVTPGHVVGDHDMFRNAMHTSTAVAQSPVVAIRLGRRGILDALAMHPRLGLRWLLSAFEQTEALRNRVAVLLSGSIKSRLAMYLVSRDENGIDITHEKLAEIIGAERASVTRAIGALRDEGMIANHRGHIRVLDRKGLEAVSAED